MKRIEGLLSRISLIQKIFIIFVGCAILPIVLQNIFYFTETEQNIQAEIYQSMIGTLENRATKISASLSDAVSVSVKFHNDVRLYRCMDGSYNRDFDYLVEYQDTVHPIVGSEIPFHLQIDGVVFYTNNPKLFNGALVRQLIPFEEEGLGDQLTDSYSTPLEGANHAIQFRTGVKYISHERDSQRFISLVRNLAYYPAHSQYRKLLRIDLNPTYYNTLLSETSLFSNILLADDQNRVLFCANTYRQTGGFDYFDPADLPVGSVVLEIPIKEYPLILYGYYDSNIISRQFSKSVMGVLGISAAGLVIALVFLLLVGSNITKRTNRIVARTRQIAQGDFGGDGGLLRTGDDEIAHIERNIDEMSSQLQTFIEREYSAKLTQSRMEKETTQAKLLALQSQVNPHFMFNALESIRLGALDGEKRETADMVKHMSKMFRYLVDWDEDIIHLQQELDFLDEFLRIQQYRFGDEFTYNIIVEEGANACLLPKLILQPLVENACIHGVEATTNEKWIAISVYVEAGSLVMEVADNGGGISPEKLEPLRRMLQGGPKIGCSVGLYNVYQRLHLNYGDAFVFEINNRPGSGTICVVKIPARTDFGEEADSLCTP